MLRLSQGELADIETSFKREPPQRSGLTWVTVIVRFPRSLLLVVPGMDEDWGKQLKRSVLLYPQWAPVTASDLIKIEAKSYTKRSIQDKRQSVLRTSVNQYPGGKPHMGSVE